MDKHKRYLFTKQPVLRANYSQDITPHERQRHMLPEVSHHKSLHSWEVPAKSHPSPPVRNRLSKFK